MSSNKTIAKNTLFLYFRMFLTMGVGLYTSRLVLQALGVEDYGIYGLVGGIVSMFSFLNSAMSAATQRYLSFDIGKGDCERLKKTFNATLNIHIIIAAIILVLAETVGLWFVNFQLKIPAERMYAANWVYQLSIFTFILGVIQVPYNALLIAREHMNVYAYMSILESVLKLVTVLILVRFGNDKLILYAVLTFVVSFLIRMLYKIYCKKYFKESEYKFYYDKIYYKELLSYSGWSLFGQLVNVLSNQGVSILFNIFLGVTINAAIMIANQVQGLVFSFISNFQVAFNPKIIKTYAKEDLGNLKDFILNTSKISFLLISALSLPILLGTELLISTWLNNNIPPFTIDLIRVIILISYIDAIGGPFWVAANAFGNVKNYNLGISMINILILPIMFVLLKNDFYPPLVYLIKFFISSFIQVFRFWYVHNKLKFSSTQIINYIKFIIVGFTFILFSCVLFEKFIESKYLSYQIYYVLIAEVFMIGSFYYFLEKKDKLIFKELLLKLKRK